MSTLNLQLLLCLDGMALPVVKQSLPIIDPYSLAGNLEDLDLEENLPVDLLSFKATGDVHWLMPALGMPLRWWSSNSCQFALLQEIRDLIKDKKSLKGGSQRMPKMQAFLVLLKVRGRILIMQNSLTLVNLALSGTMEAKKETLSWFIHELQKDLNIKKSLMDQEDPKQGHVIKRSRSGVVPQDFQSLVTSSLARLHKDPGCSGATFSPSRKSFKVHLKKCPSKFLEFRVKGLKNLELEQDEVKLVLQFDIAVCAALEALSQGTSEPGPSEEPLSLGLLSTSGASEPEITEPSLE